jgi:hypothetical protein
MAEVVNITPINPFTFELQEYSNSDSSLINSFNIDTTFNAQTDYLEYFIYDLNGNILIQNVSGYPGYKLIDNNVVLYPEVDLNAYGITEGQYNTLYNFLSPKLASNSFNTYYLSQISSDRTEVRLDTTAIPNDLVISSSLELTNDITNSTGSYYDFYLDFGNNDLVIAVNALLDTTDTNNPTVLIKLYEPLPSQFDINSQCWVVTQVSEPVAYNININQVFDVADNKIYLKGPNTNLNVTDQYNNATSYTNYNTLTGSPSNQGSGSLKYQLNSLLVKRGVEVNVDYADYSNFIHFSSAQTRLENFYYKLGLIEQYNYSASYSTGATTNYYVSQSNNIWQDKIDAIITTFDDYEYFLYFDSGSACWPKISSTPPYVNYSSNSVQGQAFLLTQSVIAEEYDIENNNALVLSIPSYLLEDPNNANFELFVEMVGQLFDNIFIYIQSVTTKADNDNRLTYGAPKDLVADILRDLGIKIYQNNFSSNDLYQALIGITPSGSLYNLPFTTTSLPAPANSGLEYITTYVTASSTSSLIPTSDLNDSIYKRIYNSVPYILKKKGSVAGLRALITLFGVPDTIIRINEFGGKDRNPNTYDNWEDTYNYAFYTSGSSYISSSFVLNTSWNASANRPQAVEFRFRTDGLPYNTGSIASQSLWETDQNIKLVLKYTGSGYNSGSYLGQPVDPYNQFAKLDFIPDPTTPNNSASVYLPFYDGGWWSVLIDKYVGTYTLYAKNKNYEGEDGNVIGWQASSSVTTAVTNWSDSTKSYFGISSSLSGKKFSGSFQEIRYYSVQLPETNFDAYVMNPYSIESSENLAFRATLGGELYTASVSVHPKVTGSWVTASSFVGNSNFYLSGSYDFISNQEVFYYDQVPAGIQNPISQKVKQQNIVLPYSSSDSNIPNANTLSPYRSIQQFPAISSSYTRDIDYVEIAFSPQNEINEDINSQLGYFNLGEVIGDPRFQSSSAETYPALNDIRDVYFEKYISNYQEWDYIRLIEFFDNSLFKMLQDFIPARSSLAAGIVIKNTLLDRNRYPVPQVNISNSIALVGSDVASSGPLGTPYTVEDMTITGSISVGITEGDSGGTYPNLLGQTSSLYTYTNVVNITQSWNGATPSVSGAVPFIQSSQTEFFDGQLSGSNLVVTTGDLSDCKVEIVPLYTTASLFSNINPNSPGDYFKAYDLDFNKTYYLSFTITEINGITPGNLQLWNAGNSNDVLYTSPTILAGGTLNVNQLELSEIFAPLTFKAIGPSSTGFSITNFIIYESYIESDCLVVQNDVQVSRVSTRYMDIDFQTNPNIAINEQVILSGSATRASVQDSNYTTARIINPRYNGCENTSPDINVLSGSKLPVVEQLTSYFAYSLGGGNTLAERSGSGNYPIAYLVDEVGNVIKPDASSSVYLPSLLDAFGAETTVVLSPTNNTTLAQSEFTVYKPAVVSNMILYSDTGSLGNDYLVSGSYASLNFNIVPGLYNQPYGLSVINAGSSITGGTIVTASFSSIILDEAQGFKTNTSFIPYTNTYTVQNTSPVRASLSASFVVTNTPTGNTTTTISLLENGIPIVQETKTIAGSATATITISSSLFLNSGSVYYFVINPGVKNISTFGDTWIINPITGSQTINKPYFTTSSVITSVLTSSPSLGPLYGSYQQTPIANSGFDAPVVLSFQPYDEIRFEGNEDLVSTIISSSFDSSTGLFNLYLQDPVNTTAINVNYFAIRRWIPSINNLIINSPSNVMGAGLILPKYPSPLLEKNLPSIIENLTNKGLI